MKILCNGLDLADALNKVTKALPIKKTMPILEGIKINAVGSNLVLSATDIDFAIIKVIKAEVQMEGEILVPGKLFNELARKLSGEKDIELNDIIDNNLTVRYEESNSTLKTMNLAEYPPIQEYEYETSFTILQKDFKAIINKTIFSAATDENRPIFKGCLMSINNKLLKCAALDGYRLAVSKIMLEKDVNTMVSIVPAKSLHEISKLLEDDEASVTVKFSKNKMMVDIEHTKIITSLISGNFMNYESTIPKDFETVITVNKKQLEESIERASILSKYEKSNLVKLEIKEGKMIITSTSEMGESKEVLSVFTKGKEMIIGFNAKYIMDCLKSVDDEFITINMNNSTSPTVIKPVEGDDYLFLIVPVRTNR